MLHWIGWPVLGYFWDLNKIAVRFFTNYKNLISTQFELNHVLLYTLERFGAVDFFVLSWIKKLWIILRNYEEIQFFVVIDIICKYFALHFPYFRGNKSNWIIRMINYIKNACCLISYHHIFKNIFFNYKHGSAPIACDFKSFIFLCTTLLYCKSINKWNSSFIYQG